LLFFAVPLTSLLYSLSLHDALPISVCRPMHTAAPLVCRSSETGRKSQRPVPDGHRHVLSAWQYSFPAHSPTQPAAVRFSATKTRSEEHTSELQSRFDLVCRLLLEKK